MAIAPAHPIFRFADQDPCECCGRTRPDYAEVEGSQVFNAAVKTVRTPLYGDRP